MINNLRPSNLDEAVEAFLDLKNFCIEFYQKIDIISQNREINFLVCFLSCPKVICEAVL